MRNAIILGLLLLLFATLGPLLAPSSTTATLDPVALRLLPPGSIVPAFTMKNGKALPIAGWDSVDPGKTNHEWHIEGKEVVYRRGPRSRRASLASLECDASGQPKIHHLHFLAGTDRYGRDLLSRLLVGGRSSLSVGLLAVLSASLLGAGLGIVSGLLGRWVDLLLSRLSDTFLAVPRIVLLMVVAALFEPGTWGLALLVGATGWPAIARLVRAETHSLAGGPMVLAARAAGVPTWRLAIRHILPHASTIVLVAAGLRLGPFVLLEASLSFLGFGITPPQPSWGNILAEGRDVLFEAWWVATLPGLLLGVTVMLANAAADRMRKAVALKK